MARRILGRSPVIGKRWPYRFFNFLPNKQVWKYLTWQSGGLAPEPDFQLGKAMADCRRLLIIVPADLQDLLVALPVIQSLVQELPKTAIKFLADKGTETLLNAIFGSERVVILDPEQFFWGEMHFREVLRGVQAFRPDLALNLRTET